MAYMDQIEETIKTFFRSYLIQENLSNRVNRSMQFKTKTRGIVYRRYSDSIDSLTTLMYDSLAEKRGIDVGGLQFGYPAIIRLVKRSKKD
jgi:hypothetical protein